MIAAILFFIYWPVSYLYFKSDVEQENFKFKKLYLVYFIPFTYYLITWFPFFIKSGKEKIDFVKLPQDSSSNIISRILAYTFMFFLLFLMVKEYRKKQSNMAESTIFLFFNIFLAFLSVTYYAYFLLIYKFHIKISNIIGFISYQLIFIIPVFMVISILFIKIKRYYVNKLNITGKTDTSEEYDKDEDMFQSDELVVVNTSDESENSDISDERDTDNISQPSVDSTLPYVFEYDQVSKEEDDKGKYKMNKISEDDAKEYLEKIIAFVEDNEAYKDSNFNLTVLSDELNIPSAYISQALNTYKKETFYTFLNKYRIELAKKMLNDSEYKNKTILAIAYESGFNSKATFNNSFKKEVGMTPSRYRKENQKNTL